MGAKKKVMLIVPPTRSYTQRLPLALMYISSYLESKGEKNTILDYKGINHKEAYKKIKQKILQEKPKFVGITCMLSEVNIVKDMCDFIKNNSSETVIVLGGPQPSISPQHFVDINVKFDYINLGEGEITMFRLIEALKRNKDTKKVRGVAFLESGKLKKTEPCEFIHNLDELPFPAYDKVNMEYYCRPNVWAMRPIYISGFTIFTSRGCPYSCKFCVAHTIWGRRVRMMSADRVVEHIEYIVKKFKIDALFFGDESFTVSKKRVYDIFNLLRKKGIRILFGMQTRVNLLDENILRFLKNNGCLQIDLGIESGSERMLKIMNKQTTPEMAARVAKICKKIGLRQLANMLINIPGETKEDIEKSLKFVMAMKYNIVLWNVYAPYPGVSWGKTLDIEDLDIILKYPSRETFELLERKYKFGDYEENLNSMEDYLYSFTYHPKHFKFTFRISYWFSMFRTMSYLFDHRYILQVLKSRRKLEYLKNFFSQKKLS